jgi:DNA invertase Pin-like site-specific DNA recombinase
MTDPRQFQPPHDPEEPDDELPTGVSGADIMQQRPELNTDVDPGLAESAVSPGNSRARGLFVIRESDKWNLTLFDAMRENTYQDQRAIPAVDAIRRAGLAPMEYSSFTVQDQLPNGEAVESKVLVTELREGSTKALLFFHKGYWHLWSRASAHALDSGTGQRRENAFTTILMRTIQHLRPRCLFAANLSRLVRSMGQGSRLTGVLLNNVDHIYVKEMRFDLSGPYGSIGLIFLNVLTWVAAMERDAIMMRLTAGRISKWRRGAWAFGKQIVPFGYKLDDRGFLRPDASKRPIIREMLLLLSTDLPNKAMQTALGDLGVTAMRDELGNQQPAPFGALSNSEDAISALYAWASLWVNGEYLLRHSNPISRAEEIAGIKITRHQKDGKDDPDDDGELQLLHKVDLPEDGWAEPEVLQAFLSRARARTRHLIAKGRNTTRPLSDAVADASKQPDVLTGILPNLWAVGHDKASSASRDAGRAKSIISALSGRTWDDDEGTYELQVVKTGVYELAYWPNTTPPVTVIEQAD